ncbi:UDP-N-acetylmuramate--L-alanine ligase [Phenylobacterium terrae]|uniref:UDP-N-acetylmuramate--L-alanine ligase n=1 Tax=Phenylobacterium terrae TaxID=2665495 RepID=A0ABW4MY32_9CAUL
MTRDRAYFFCGVGGSGMAPLALIVKARGAEVEGSDRALDQGRNLDKFEFLKRSGVGLHPQDGSGLTGPHQTLVASAAIEDSVPDVAAAKRVGASLMLRAELLSQLFNDAPVSVGVAGTSGKSTTTGMIGWMLAQAGASPTIVNGAEMKNFITPETPYASAVVGEGEVFAAEVDESDGSIARYTPTIAVVNNVSLDHKSMEELRELFGAFVEKSQVAVLNLDNEETAALAAGPGEGKSITYSLTNPAARLIGGTPVPAPDGIEISVADQHTGDMARLTLQVPGVHNVYNAMAAMGVGLALGMTLEQTAEALARFTGIRRRMDVVGTRGGVTVIDDFAHNPDKLTATLDTLHAFDGRLLLMFQPHGFGPLRLMKQEFIDVFAGRMTDEDVLVMPEPVYYGGTVDRSVSTADVISGIAERGKRAEAFPDRAACGERLLELARPGDRIVVMGARDDTLSAFAAELLERLAKKAA